MILSILPQQTRPDDTDFLRRIFSEFGDSGMAAMGTRERNRLHDSSRNTIFYHIDDVIFEKSW